MGIIKPWEELSFQDDYMFKRVMSHKRLCKKMLENSDRDSGYPLSGRGKDHQDGLREQGHPSGCMCRGRQKYGIQLRLFRVRKPENDGLFKRTRYCQSMIDGDLLMAGAKYDTLKDTIRIGRLARWPSAPPYGNTDAIIMH